MDKREEGKQSFGLHCATSNYFQDRNDHDVQAHIALIQAIKTAPTSDPACLYGLVGDVARIGSEGTETNPLAIALNFIAYLSCALGRGPYIAVGNTRHHARQYCLHIGRSGRGRKGDALSIVLRIDQALRDVDASFAPTVHRGGLSTREGLIMLFHDGFNRGKLEVPAVEDKRLWIVESEFANVLHRSRRDGSTLSTALRDCWDGVGVKPAIKFNRISVTNPHLCLSGAISPTELISMINMREITNGFANRFMMVWAERTGIVPFPKETPQSAVAELAARTYEILQYVQANRNRSGDRLRVEMSSHARWHYAQLYRGELNEDLSSEIVNALLERRAPMLLRLAMLFALTDQQLRIDCSHLDAALAWLRLGTATVRYIFGGAQVTRESARVLEIANRITAFLGQQGLATRRDITVKCFQGHVSKKIIDAAIAHLEQGVPSRILVEKSHRPKESPGAPTTTYRLA
jgi:hypothetical protein